MLRRKLYVLHIKVRLIVLSNVLWRFLHLLESFTGACSLEAPAPPCVAPFPAARSKAFLARLNIRGRQLPLAITVDEMIRQN